MNDLNRGELMLVAICIAILILELVSWWKIFEKAEEPGWVSLVPFYNMYMLVKVSGRNPWFTLALLVPFLNFFVYCYLYFGLSKRFSRGVGFAIGLILLNPIFMAILGFGKSQYYHHFSPSY